MRRTKKRRDPKNRLLVEARYRAKRDGIPFNIALSDITIPKRCPVLGVAFRYGDYNRAPSLDRVVPEFGYVKWNVVVMSRRANRIKNNSSLDELRRLVNFLTRFFRRQVSAKAIKARKR